MVHQLLLKAIEHKNVNIPEEVLEQQRQFLNDKGIVIEQSDTIEYKIDIQLEFFKAAGKIEEAEYQEIKTMLYPPAPEVIEQPPIEQPEEPSNEEPQPQYTQIII